MTCFKSKINAIISYFIILVLEMDELKHDIGNICSSVEKLRHEVMYLHGRLPSSSARGSISPNDRDSGCLHTEMDI